MAPTTGTNTKYSDAQNEFICQLKQEGHTWAAIAGPFNTRFPPAPGKEPVKGGALQVHYSRVKLAYASHNTNPKPPTTTPTATKGPAKPKSSRVTKPKKAQAQKKVAVGHPSPAPISEAAAIPRAPRASALNHRYETHNRQTTAPTPAAAAPSTQPAVASIPVGPPAAKAQATKSQKHLGKRKVREDDDDDNQNVVSSSTIAPPTAKGGRKKAKTHHTSNSAQPATTTTTTTTTTATAAPSPSPNVTVIDGPVGKPFYQPGEHPQGSNLFKRTQTIPAELTGKGKVAKDTDDFEWVQLGKSPPCPGHTDFTTWYEPPLNPALDLGFDCAAREKATTREQGTDWINRGRRYAKQPYEVDTRAPAGATDLPDFLQQSKRMAVTWENKGDQRDYHAMAGFPDGRDPAARPRGDPKDRVRDIPSMPV